MTDNESHNTYSEETKITLKNLPNYLILVEKTFEGKNTSEIFCADCVTKAIELATECFKGRISAIYRLNGTMGKNYTHYFDASTGVY